MLWLSRETSYGCVEAHGFPRAVQLKLAQVKVLLGEKVCYPESRARVKGASSCWFLKLYSYGFNVKAFLWRLLPRGLLRGINNL